MVVLKKLKTPFRACNILLVALVVIPCRLGATQQLKPESASLWMTVCVHGTAGAASNISFKNIYRIMVDQVENTPYERAVDLMRSNPYMFKNQPMQEYGLRRVDHTTRQPGQAAALFAHIYNHMLQETFKKNIETQYYTFGWSGVLSESIRYRDSARFYNELLLEYRKLQQENPHKKVKICIIGYSHGGTIALQLARVFEKEQSRNPLTIDLLILLGTPVQKETDHLVANSIFKKVYHIYSRGDKVQRMDFFSFNRFFSYRRFNDDTRFVTPDKVVQIELKIKPPRRAYKKGERKTYVNRSPGHIELWFFGWTEGMYRNEFPLYPLPAACLIPTLIKAAQVGMPHETDLTIELFPSSKKCNVRKRRYFKKVEVSILNYELLKQLQETARKETPMDFTRKEYLSQMNAALTQAYNTISERHRKGYKCRDFSCIR